MFIENKGYCGPTLRAQICKNNSLPQKKISLDMPLKGFSNLAKNFGQKF